MADRVSGLGSAPDDGGGITGRDNNSLLVIVLDTSPNQKIYRESENVLSQCLDGVMAFCNSHLMMNPLNKLAVITCHANHSVFLYPTNDSPDSNLIKPMDGRYELFVQVNNSIRDKIKELFKNSLQDVIYAESLLAGALCMALCYINRIAKEREMGVKIASRILIITGAEDFASQYMHFMNVFFTAQKQNVIIDTCMLNKDSGLLQQGCDITGGIYLKIPHVAGILQYLLWVFLPGLEERKLLALPPSIQVDFRAACFCHRNLVDIGYVCSVCLSIFCSFSPICSTCQTVFKFLGPPLSKMKKKKLK